MKVVIFILSILFIQNICSQTFEDGIQKYNEAKYSEATEIWLNLLDANPTNDNIMYNLGNAYNKQGQYAEAIYWYQSALKQNPNNSDATENLKLTEKLSGIDNYDVSASHSSTRILNTLSRLSPFYFMFAYALLTSLSIWIRKKTNNRSLSQWIFFLGLIFLIPVIIRLLGSNNTQEVIVMQNCSLKVSPDQQSESRLELKAGEKLLLLDQLDDWTKVRTASYDDGWIKCDMRKLR